MKNTVITVALTVGTFFIGSITQKSVLAGVLEAAIMLAVGLHEQSKEKKKAQKMAQEPIQAEQPKPAKAGKTLRWILGSLIVIIVCIMTPQLIFLAVGAVLLIGMIQFVSAEHQRDKQRTEEWLDDYRERLHERSEDSRRRDELHKQKREAAKAEAAHLEEQARLWERNAKKYGAPSDIQKARYYREQANAAKRKLW